MAKGKKTGGRKKGTPNKLSLNTKETIAWVAEDLGGPARMAQWVREDPEHERIFWASIYPRLLPLELQGKHEHSGSLEFTWKAPVMPYAPAGVPPMPMPYAPAGVPPMPMPLLPPAPLVTTTIPSWKDGVLR